VYMLSGSIYVVSKHRVCKSITLVRNECSLPTMDVDGPGSPDEGVTC